MNFSKRHRWRQFAFLFGAGLVLLVLGACVSPSAGPAKTAPSLTPDPESLMFTQARQAYADGDLQDALGRLSSYLARYPQGHYADEALFMMADVYRQMGQPDAAMAFFDRLVEVFPHSPRVDQSLLALIDLLLAAGRTEEGLARLNELLEKPISEELRMALWERGYQVAAERNEFGPAAKYAYLLYQAVPEENRSQWMDYFIQNTARLSQEDIEGIWDLVDDPLRSYLIYRFAVLQVMQEHYDIALEMVTLFLDQYPHHPYAGDAAGLVDTLSQRLAFKPYTIGCLLPLSGPYAAYGQRALNGIALAVSLLQSGETSLPVKLIVKDTASDEVQAVQAVRELVDDGVAAIIGPIIAAPAAAREAQRLQMPMVTITQKSDVTETGNYIFRHFITPQNQVRTLVDYFVNTIGLTEFAVMYPQETYGKAFMNLFWDEIIRQGGHLVGVESYDASQTDFADPIKKLVGAYYTVPEDLETSPTVRKEESPYFHNPSETQDRLDYFLPDPVARLTGLFFQRPDQDRAKGPAIGRIREDDSIDPIIDFDVLFIPDAPKIAGLIIPQLAFYDIKDIYLAGTNLWHSAQLVEMSKDYLQKAILVDGFFKESQSQAVQRFAEDFRSVFNQDPGIIAAFAFDTARLLMDVIATPNIQMRHQVRNALVHAFHADGVTGPTAFDENGEPLKKLSLLRIKGGRFTEIRNP